MHHLKLTLGHSPDPDDAFMFYPLAKGLVPTNGLTFEHRLEDIQTLNERALRGELDISAISFHAYAYVNHLYALLPCGASMGDGYGPMLVARRHMSRDDILMSRIAVPGKMTSAFLALQLWLGQPLPASNLVFVPFDQVFSAVKSGKADVGLIIHEGQLTWDQEGLVNCQDLGKWWSATNNGLPLPLGGNVIHKRIPQDVKVLIARILKESVKYALDHRAEAVEYSLQFARDMGRNLADRFIGMYVNHWTLDYGKRGAEAIRRFLGQAHAMGLTPTPPELEFVN